jgi:hypothetical protein
VPQQVLLSGANHPTEAGGIVIGAVGHGLFSGVAEALFGQLALTLQLCLAGWSLRRYEAVVLVNRIRATAFLVRFHLSTVQAHMILLDGTTAIQ